MPVGEFEQTALPNRLFELGQVVGDILCFLLGERSLPLVLQNELPLHFQIALVHALLKLRHACELRLLEPCEVLKKLVALLDGRGQLLNLVGPPHRTHFLFPRCGLLATLPLLQDFLPLVLFCFARLVFS